MSTKAEREERMLKLIVQDRKRRTSWKPESAKDRLNQIEGRVTEANIFTLLGRCLPGTPFAIDECVLYGTVIHGNDCSVRVLLINGEDTRLSPNTIVRTMSKLPPLTKRVRSGSRDNKPKDVQPVVRKRFRIVGHTWTRLIYWMALEDWTYDQIMKAFDHYGASPSESTVLGCMEYCDNPKYSDPADLTESQKKELREAGGVS